MKRKIIRDIFLLSIILFSIPTFILLIIARIEKASVMYFLGSLFTITLLGCILRLIYKRVLVPLSTLKKETEIISKGDLSHKISYQYDDEIGQFIATFDDMRNTLYLKQLEQEKFEVDRKEFIDSISHDLRTPIAAISAYVEALQDDIAQTEEEQKNYLSVIEDKITVLKELASQLNLTYQTTDLLSLNFQSVSSFIWAGNFVEQVKIECQTKNIDIKINNHLTESFPDMIMVDIIQLNRALQNMLDNAYRFSEKVLSLAIEKDNNSLIIRIENDGVTISNSQLHQIFQRFYTDNKQNIQGHLGLGLSIADTLISAMGGQIKAVIHNKNIVFEVKLPYSTV
ncbi:HAMP domain-containing histidine kinase [Listeria monocytogenes]|nr:HAMP domain-containing histidine kinase [Listeria monocytogenes]